MHIFCAFGANPDCFERCGNVTIWNANALGESQVVLQHWSSSVEPACSCKAQAQWPWPKRIGTSHRCEKTPLSRFRRSQLLARTSLRHPSKVHRVARHSPNVLYSSMNTHLPIVVAAAAWSARLLRKESPHEPCELSRASCHLGAPMAS